MRGAGRRVGDRPAVEVDSRNVDLALAHHDPTAAVSTVCALLTNDAATAIGNLPDPRPPADRRPQRRLRRRLRRRQRLLQRGRRERRRCCAAPPPNGAKLDQLPRRGRGHAYRGRHRARPVHARPGTDRLRRPLRQLSAAPGVPPGSVGPDGRRPRRAYDRLRRRVLWSMPTGLYVVGSRHGDRRNLMTANWVMQVATAPKLVAVAVESGSVTRRLIEAGGGFSVSLLPRADRAVVRRFVKPVSDIALDADGGATAVQGEPVHEVADGCPAWPSALGWLACRVLQRSIRGGRRPADGPASHVLVMGEVVDAGESRARRARGDGTGRCCGWRTPG